MSRRARPFDRTHRQDRLSLRRVNGEGFFDPRCLPSTNAFLVRAACAATSANPPATSARFCHRSSASSALFSPLPHAFARLRGRRPTPFFRCRAYPFRLAAETFRSRRLGRGVERRSSTSAITTSDPRAQPSNRPIPADSISKVPMSFFRGPAGLELLQRPKPLPISRPVTGLLPSSQGPVASLSLCTSGLAALRALSRVRRVDSMTTPISTFARTSRRRARGE